MPAAASGRPTPGSSRPAIRNCGGGPSGARPPPLPTKHRGEDTPPPRKKKGKPSPFFWAPRPLVRYEPRWQALASAMKKRGKPIPLIVAAVANRWVRTLHHQLAGYGLAV